MDIEIKNVLGRHQLDNAEFREYANELTDAIQSMNETESDLKSIRAQYKSQIEELDAKIAKLREIVHNGYLLQNIPCELIENTEDGVIEYVSQETGDILKTEPLPSQSPQEEVFESETDPVDDGQPVEEKDWDDEIFSDEEELEDEE